MKTRTRRDQRSFARWLVLAAGVVVLAVGTLVALAYWSTVRSVSWEGAGASIEEVVQGWANLDGVPGALLHVEVAGHAVVSEAAGWMSNDRQTRLQPGDPFHIASIGKLFTAATVLRLAERGVLNLDAPIAERLGEDALSGLVVVAGADYGGQITARQLLTHRAGLGNTDDRIAFQARVLSFEFADGGFVSTAPDLARLGRALIEGRLFERPETLDVFLSPAPGEARDSLFQAHGPLVIRDEGRTTTVLHQGFWGTALIIEPEVERVSVIALGQSNASTWQFWRQARDLIPVKSSW